MPLQNGTDNEHRPITRSSPVDSFSSSQNLHQSSVDSNVFMTNGQTPPHHSSSSSLRVQIESPASSIYMAQNEPSVFVPSPTIPLQNRTSSSGGSKYSSMFSSFMFSVVVFSVVTHYVRITLHNLLSITHLYRFHSLIFLLEGRLSLKSSCTIVMVFLHNSISNSPHFMI